MPTDTEMEEVRQRHRRTFVVTLLLGIPGAVLASMAVIGIVWRVFIATAVIQQVQVAVADELEQKMAAALERALERQVSPINEGLKVNLQTWIADLEDDIARLEYRQQLARQNSPAVDWSTEDALELSTKRRRLEGARDALLAIRRAERGTGR